MKEKLVFRRISKGFVVSSTAPGFPKTRRLTTVYTDQFNNKANWKAHYHGTAKEIWRQTNQTITTFVATLGTTGTLMGVSRCLKEYNPDIQIVGVEPFLGHKIQGLKNMKEAYCPEIFERQRLDIKLNV